MIKWIRHLRISLAAKCQILFGAAVILIIAAALYVPWRRMEGLMQDRNLQAGEVLAVQAKMEHVAHENLLAQNLQLAPAISKLEAETPPLSIPNYVPPRL